MLTTSFIRVRAVAAVGALLLTSALPTATSSAQSADARWQPWSGCWIPEGESIGAGGSSGKYVCVVPAASAPSVDIVTLADYRVMHTERVNANGQRIAKTVDGCPGWESATWSSDSHRLFMRSEFTCSNKATVTASGIFAISDEGHWVQIQGNTVGKNSTTRVVRYQPISLQIAAGESLADSSVVRTAILESRMSINAMRQLAGESPEIPAVIEVSKQVDTPVAQAWLAEVGRQMKTADAKTLAALADAKVAPQMIDMVVALSYPERFVLQQHRQREQGANTRNPSAGADDFYSNDWNCGYGGRMTSYGYYGGGCYPSMYGSSMYGYGAAGFGYRYANYGHGYGSSFSDGYYYGSSPIIVVDRNAGKPATTGRAVNGQGYQRTGGESSGSAQKTGGYQAPASTTTSGSSGGSGGSGSGSSSGSGGGGGDRTAKARPPGK